MTIQTSARPSLPPEEHQHEGVVVVGVGYVGLPLAVAIAATGTEVLGFDVDSRRVAQLRDGYDATGTFSGQELSLDSLTFSDDDGAVLAGFTCFIVTVPTPLTSDKRPDLTSLISACRSIGRALRPGGLVIVESTVYPGATREVCLRVLEQESGLRCGPQFSLAYSPERINPGDSEHTLATVVKLVAGYDEQSATRAARLYRLMSVDVTMAASLEVAELAKTIENSQRDLNIAFSNEVSRICAQLGLDTMTVLAACATKWNFQAFRPGLVGGHCIPVDPYYLIHRSSEKGYFPQLLSDVRRANEAMPAFLADRLVGSLRSHGVDLPAARVALVGATFKADVPDARNSGVIELHRELTARGVTALVCDPLLPEDELRELFPGCATAISELRDLDLLVALVDHRTYRENLKDLLSAALRPNGIFADFADLRTVVDMPPGIAHLRL